MWEIQVQSLSQEDRLEKEIATHSGIAWRIPWMEEPGGLQSMEAQRVVHDWVTNTFTFNFETHTPFINNDDQRCGIFKSSTESTVSF